MHIVYLCREYLPTLRGGGIASYIYEIAHAISKLGNKVTIVAASDDTRASSDDIKDSIRVIRLSGGDFVIPSIEGNTFFKKFRHLNRFWSYRKKIRECILSLKDVDVIEVPEYGAESLYLHDLNIPIVIRLHTPTLLDHRTFQKIHFSNFKNLPFCYPQHQELKEVEKAKYITSCSASLKEWTETYTKVQKNKIQVIWNPIQPNAIDVPKTKSNEENAPIHILFAGTICDWKGCEDLAQAGILLSKQTNRQFSISFVGKTGKWAENLAQRYKSFPWFILVGKISREDLMQRYRQADVIVFPSWWENLPMVCLEAMMQGGIVIGSSSGGMSEIIEDGISGFLIPPHSPEAISNAIVKALQMPGEQKQQMRHKARQRILTHFSTDVIVQQMQEYYRWVIRDYHKA